MPNRIRTLLDWIGRVGLAFLVLLLLYLVLDWIPVPGGLRLAAGFGVVITGVWLVVRLLLRAARHAIWRLRNRLLVTYLFIAVVPILLVAALAGLGGYSLVNQLAVFLVTSALDRRIDQLASITDSVVRTDQASRPPVMERTIDLFYRDRYPGIEILLRESGREIRYPEGATIPAPLSGWKPRSGVLVREGNFYLWSYAQTLSGDVTVTAPLTSEFLAELVPKLGLVNVGPTSQDSAKTLRDARGIATSTALPPARNRFDPEVVWVATLLTAVTGIIPARRARDCSSPCALAYPPS